MERYYGLIELAFSFGAFCLFLLWQMRQLNRDVKAREARERQEAEQQRAAEDKPPKT